MDLWHFFSHLFSFILKVKSTSMSKVTTYANTYETLKLVKVLMRKEPNNPVNKYAVSIRKSGKVVGHWKEGATDRFAKTVFFFLEGDPYSKTTSGRRCNLGDGEGLQVPCKLKLVGHWKFIDLLQDELIKLK